jgi:hypothetical protein
MSEDSKWVSEGWQTYPHSEKDAVKEGNIKNFKAAIGGKVNITREGETRWAPIKFRAAGC